MAWRFVNAISRFAMEMGCALEPTTKVWTYRLDVLSNRRRTAPTSGGPLCTCKRRDVAFFRTLSSCSSVAKRMTTSSPSCATTFLGVSGDSPGVAIGNGSFLKTKMALWSVIAFCCALYLCVLASARPNLLNNGEFNNAEDVAPFFGVLTAFGVGATLLVDGAVFAGVGATAPARAFVFKIFPTLSELGFTFGIKARRAGFGVTTGAGVTWSNRFTTVLARNSRVGAIPNVVGALAPWVGEVGADRCFTAASYSRRRARALVLPVFSEASRASSVRLSGALLDVSGFLVGARVLGAAGVGAVGAPSGVGAGGANPKFSLRLAPTPVFGTGAGGAKVGATGF